jgi:hypothetical protein
MVGAENQDERRKHPVKEHGNRSAGPALERVERHADAVADDHHREVHGTDAQENGSQPSPWRNEDAPLADEIKAPLPCEEDDKLAGEELRIGHEARKPFLPGRKECAVPDRDERLGQHPQDEQAQERRQRDGVAAETTIRKERQSSHEAATPGPVSNRPLREM